MKKAPKIGFVLNLLSMTLCIAVAYAQTPKVLYVNSYHKGFAWCDSIERGLFESLDCVDQNGNASSDRAPVKVDSSKSPVELVVWRMDTKRNTAKAWKKAEAQKIMAYIKTWKPDIVLLSDDNAAIFLGVPYLLDSKIPVVFCGTAWDVSQYGFDKKNNVTGMIEVAQIEHLFGLLKQHAKGKRLGIMGADTLSCRRASDNYQRVLGVKATESWAKTAAQFKTQYVELQKKTDIIILEDLFTLKGYDRDDMVRFLSNNIQVPTGALYEVYAYQALITCANMGEEQGDYMGRTALRILNGDRPEEIPLVENKKAKIYLNMTLAQKLGITFSMQLIEDAIFVEENKAESR
jgi:ABC-type uncharacterized transport system substrate-binding protein